MVSEFEFFDKQLEVVKWQNRLVVVFVLIDKVLIM